MGLGSLLKKILGGSGNAEPKPEEAIDYKGYQIYLRAREMGGQYGVGGLIRKEIDGQLREHVLIRADQAPSRDICDEITLQKARTLIDQMGDKLFDS